MFSTLHPCAVAYTLGPRDDCQPLLMSLRPSSRLKHPGRLPHSTQGACATLWPASRSVTCLWQGLQRCVCSAELNSFIALRLIRVHACITWSAKV